FVDIQPSLVPKLYDASPVLYQPELCISCARLTSFISSVTLSMYLPQLFICARALLYSVAAFSICAVVAVVLFVKSSCFFLASSTTSRSEERRVGKECRSRGWPDHYKERE